MPKAKQQGMDLLDLLAEMERDEAPEPVREPPPFPLCRCAFTKSAGWNGWTLERDKTSIYYGMWVHAHPDCRQPRHPHLNGKQER